MLVIQGFMDSLKGEESIPDARIEGMKNKCMAIEKREALIIESRYEPVRKEGARALSNYIGSNADAKTVLSTNNDGSPYAIRTAARNEARRAGKRAEAEQAKLKLIEVSESLIHADTVLSERIRRTREKALNVKIAAYIKGVRKGKLPDYDPDLEMDDDAYGIYINRHKPYDEAIFKTVENMTQEVM